MNDTIPWQRWVEVITPFYYADTTGKARRKAKPVETKVGDASVAGVDPQQVMVPRGHPPAEEAEVDFGEFPASIGGW